MFKEKAFSQLDSDLLLAFKHEHVSGEKGVMSNLQIIPGGSGSSQASQYIVELCSIKDRRKTLGAIPISASLGLKIRSVIDDANQFYGNQ